MVGQLPTEHSKQAVGTSDRAGDKCRIGAAGDVELGGVNWWARFRLASPLTGVFNMLSNSALVCPAA